MKFRLFSALLVTFFSAIWDVRGQMGSLDSLSYQSAREHTLAVYYNQLKDQSPLLNGSLYAEYEFTFREGSPYFLTEKFTAGSVVYNGVLYNGIPLLYDDLRGLLISKNQVIWLQLINRRVDAFSIANHYFVRFEANSSQNGLPATGYYEVLYAGRSQILKQSFKKIREVLAGNEGVVRFVDETDDYYIKTGNTYQRVKSKSELLDILADHQKELQRMIKKNKLNFRKDKENAMVQSAEYYDQIPK